jgi:hypothetical protein
VPTNPERINLSQETLDFRRPGFSPGLSLLMLAESLLYAPTLLSVCLRGEKNALLPRALRRIHNFGTVLQPRWIVGAELLDQ